MHALICPYCSPHLDHAAIAIHVIISLGGQARTQAVVAVVAQSVLQLPIPALHIDLCVRLHVCFCVKIKSTSVLHE